MRRDMRPTCAQRTLMQELVRSPKVTGSDCLCRPMSECWRRGFGSLLAGQLRHKAFCGAACFGLAGSTWTTWKPRCSS